MKAKTKSLTKAKQKTSSFLWESSLSQAPSQPGVYWFLDDKAQVIYVGKAKNLKRRLSSYTRITPRSARTYSMVTTAKSVEFVVLGSEFEALLTEADLIGAHQPHFNVLLKDDKSRLYVIVTDEDFPRVLTARRKQLSTVYSNLPSKNVFGPFAGATQAKQVIKLSRRIFKFCNASLISKRSKRACFYTHINLCSGACSGQVSQKEYGLLIGRLRRFLRDKQRSLVKALEKDMKLAAEAREFEKAGELRDQLMALKHVYSMQVLRQDSVLPVLEDDVAADTLVKLSSVLHQTGLVSNGYPLDRIECYDISNTQADKPTASMVVFTAGKPDTDNYRMFKMRTAGPNDYGMMREALRRRLNHPEWGTPSLIVIDGGKGQLRSALKEIEGSLPVVSIAKNPDRLLIPRNVGSKLSYAEIKLKPGERVSDLIINLRDEAHRFAKSFHTRLRRKALVG